MDSQMKKTKFAQVLRAILMTAIIISILFTLVLAVMESITAVNAGETKFLYVLTMIGGVFTIWLTLPLALYDLYFLTKYFVSEGKTTFKTALNGLCLLCDLSIVCLHISKWLKLINLFINSVAILDVAGIYLILRLIYLTVSALKRKKGQKTKLSPKQKAGRIIIAVCVVLALIPILLYLYIALAMSMWAQSMH